MCWTVGYWITDSFCCWVGPQVVDQTGEFTDRFSNGFCMFLCAFVRVIWVIWVDMSDMSHGFSIVCHSSVSSRCQGKIAEAAWSALGFKAGFEIRNLWDTHIVSRCFSLFLNSVFLHIFQHIFQSSLKSQGGIQSVGLKVGDAWPDLKLHGIRAQSSKAGHVSRVGS